MICDRIGILKAGRLVREGDLSELTRSASNVWEVTLAGFEAAGGVGVRRLSSRADETLVRVEGEAALRRLLERVWGSGGRVVSAVPIRRTLEEIFLHEVRDESARESR